MVMEHSVMLVSHNTLPITDNATPTSSALDQIDLSHLKTEECAELNQLLNTFCHVFAENPIPKGQTSVVQHSIPTTGPPI